MSLLSLLRSMPLSGFISLRTDSSGSMSGTPPSSCDVESEGAEVLSSHLARF